MYNGIGLQTVRGSGTNGYVQTNKSFIKHTKDRVDYKSEEELKKLDAQMNRGPNEEILQHERKRKVELKCMEMQELMEEQGYTEEEITSKVATFRKMLLDKEGVIVDTDQAGRPIAKDTHQIAEAAQAKNEALKAALGISEYFVEGSSLDPTRKAKEDNARALVMAQKKYAILKDDEGSSSDASSSSSSSRSPSPKRKKKKKHHHHRSDSPSSKRQKHEKHDKHDKHDKQDKHKKSKKRRHRDE